MKIEYIECTMCNNGSVLLSVIDQELGKLVYIEELK